MYIRNNCSLTLMYLDAGIKASYASGQFKFIYYPTASELIFADENTVDTTGISDRVGNVGPDINQLFVLP